MRTRASHMAVRPMMPLAQFPSVPPIFELDYSSLPSLVESTFRENFDRYKSLNPVTWAAPPVTSG